MTLIRCSECGREYSDKASACVHCGCPTEYVDAERETSLEKDIINKDKSENEEHPGLNLTQWLLDPLFLGAGLLLAIGVLGFWELKGWEQGEKVKVERSWNSSISHQISEARKKGWKVQKIEPYGEMSNIVYKCGRIFSRCE